MCEAEPLPSYYNFFKDLSILLNKYWTGGYDHSNCDKFPPSYERLRKNDLILLSILTTFFGIFHLIGSRFFRQFYSRRFPGVSLNNIQRSAEISCDAVVRMLLIIWSVVLLFGSGSECSVLWSHRDIVLHSHMSLITGHAMPAIFRLTIAMQASSYTWSIIALFINIKRKDFLVLLAHHIITIGLLYIGYTYNQPDVGIWIALLHDVVDPFIDVMRVIKFLQLLTMSVFNDMLYVFCLALWVGSRLYLFPLTAINPIVTLSYLSPASYCPYEYIGSVSSFFAVLLLLNVIWTIFIARLGFFRLWYGFWTDVTSEGRSERRELRRKKQL